jgi:hypothetical protein
VNLRSSFFLEKTGEDIVDEIKSRQEEDDFLSKE